MNICVSQKSPGELYHLFTQCIVPRPIAWVLSDNGDGHYNLAPFSYFTGLSSSPPLICVSIGKKPDGSPKDTHFNIENRDQFVLHIPSVEDAELLSNTAEHLAFGESEIDKYNIPLIHDEAQSLPRLKSTQIAFYCKKHQIIPIEGAAQVMIIGEVTTVYIKDDIVTSNGSRLTIDPKKLNPLARLGGASFAELGRVFDIKRK